MADNDANQTHGAFRGAASRLHPGRAGRARAVELAKSGEIGHVAYDPATGTPEGVQNDHYKGLTVPLRTSAPIAPKTPISGGK